MLNSIIAGSLALGLIMTSVAVAGPGPFKTYYILRLADYKAATGCNTHNYARSLRTALGFLVFEDRKHINSIQYARRHTLPLFDGLRHHRAAPGGSVDEKCLSPSLRQIGFALKMMDSKGRFGKFLSPGFVYDPAILKTGPANPKAFPVMSRKDYVAITGCKVSQSSYDEYRKGFDWVVFKLWYRKQGRTGMIKFLDDLFASRPTTDGFVDQKCMIPTISRIATVLGLLDGIGRYHSRR